MRAWRRCWRAGAWAWTCAAVAAHAASGQHHAARVVAAEDALVLAPGEHVVSAVRLWNLPTQDVGAFDSSSGEQDQTKECDSDAERTTSHRAGEENETEDNRDGLLVWAAQQTHITQSPLPPPRRPFPCIDCFLVVGVKTRVVEGFQSRQLIRATWAHPDTTRRLHARVVFLACEPDPDQEADMSRTLDALAREKHVYGDLLTHELGGCMDSYHRLVDKVVGYFHWVMTHHPTVVYVMTADDDVYIRLDHVVTMLHDKATPRTRYYAGQVPSAATGRFEKAMRMPHSKYYLPDKMYPMSEHSPRAIGPHYLLSADLVRFLTRNRHDLRGAGSIEDLSIGYWMLALLQVHPVHLPVFDSILSNLCRKALVSYGDLSLQAIRQIHTNLKRGDPLCRGFSWAAWVNPNAKQPDYPKIKPRSDVTYEWKFRTNPFTRTLRIDITVQLPLVPLTLPVVTFTPSHGTYNHLCTTLDHLAASFPRRLPIMLCDDLLNRLDKVLQEEQSTNSALFALTRSNLPPFSGVSVAVSVWISDRVLRWRTLIECLLAEIYPDIHIYVLDPAMSPTPRTQIDPDFVVVADDEHLNPPQVPAHCRFLVFITTTAGTHSMRSHYAVHPPDGVILLTRDQVERSLYPAQPLPPQLYVPLASMVFSDSLVHSPAALLRASYARNPDFSPIKLLAVPHCNPRATSLAVYLQATHHDCATRKTFSHELHDGNTASRGESTPATVFAFDADVARYARTKFVLAFEKHQSTSGYIGGTIVAAFVAGSVPIYDGDDATVARLFNPKAFINCGRFASLQDCGEFVKQVDRSPTLYAAMRREPPVVNETAFYEAFSWHPDVLARLRVQQTRDELQRLGMAERLRDMVNSL